MSVRVRKSVTSGQEERETTLDRACDEVDLPPTPVTPKLVGYLKIKTLHQDVLSKLKIWLSLRFYGIDKLCKDCKELKL